MLPSLKQWMDIRYKNTHGAAALIVGNDTFHYELFRKQAGDWQLVNDLRGAISGMEGKSDRFTDREIDTVDRGKVFAKKSMTHVALPDHLFTHLIFSFDKLPKSRADLEKLIQWRLVKEYQIDVTATQFFYKKKQIGMQYAVNIYYTKLQMLQPYYEWLNAQRIYIGKMAPLSLFLLDFIRCGEGGSGAGILAHNYHGWVTICLWDKQQILQHSMVLCVDEAFHDGVLLEIVRAILYAIYHLHIEAGCLSLFLLGFDDATENMTARIRCEFGALKSIVSCEQLCSRLCAQTDTYIHRLMLGGGCGNE